jgi:hypothetical protein
VPREGKQVALGPELDPAAHLVHRAWIGPVVRIEVTDPDDPTPYWIVSSRDPDALVAALAARNDHDPKTRRSPGPHAARGGSVPPVPGPSDRA